MTENDSIAQKLLDIFGGNPWHAKSDTAPNGDRFYSPVEQPLTVELIQDHINGIVTLGSYHLLKGSETVKWLGFDVDAKDDIPASRDIVTKLTRVLSSVPYCVEFSGGKGYHVLIFLKEPMEASKAKKVVDWIREKEGFAVSGAVHVECFPKQTSLPKGHPKGNLLKIPLGLHPRTHERSRFVDPFNGWENGPLLDESSILSYRADNEDVLCLIEEEPPADAQLVKLMASNWGNGKSHDLSLYLSGFLAHENWGMDQVKTLMTQICEAAGDTDVYNRTESVEYTFQKHKEGKSIRGRQGLGEMLPVSVMQKLTELVSKLKAPDSVGQIDDIRFTKGRPPIENARLASSTIWSMLNDDGCKLFQTDQNYAYWYDSNDHSVTEEGSEMWRAILNKRFGMNPADPFSKLVFLELRLRILREAPIVQVQNRTFWQENPARLYVNLGGPEVYILDGETIETAYNGECGHMFVTNPNKRFIIPDFESAPINAWDYLVNDVSFTMSSDAPAKPEEQRELFKAWLLAFFFQELLPTKPILAMLGEAGSGKTTAIRRVLRIYEDPDSDVLGIPTDKQDAFRASIASHRLLVLDNLEKSGAYWMIDMLNKLATGNSIELRELYKTNVKHVINPKCFVACTAVNMPFSDETLFSRLLVLEMQKVDEPLAEHEMQTRIKENHSKIWADLLRKLNDIIKTLIENPKVKTPTKSRLVDFTVFCARIEHSTVVDGRALNLGLLSMVDSQLRQLKESSQAISLIEEWISSRSNEASEWHTYQELFVILQMMAQSRRVDFKWKNPVGLGRHLMTLQDRLRQDFGAEFEVSVQGDKEISKLRFRTMM
jgi:hypothetical protein